MKFRYLVYFFLLIANFSSGFAVWQPPQQLTTTGNASYSTIAGGNIQNALLSFLDGDGTYASFFSNGSWNTTQITPDNDFSPKVAMDATGTGLLLWGDRYLSPFTVTFRGSYFDGTSFQAPTDFQTVNFFYNDAIAMSGNGNGIASWIDDGSNIQVTRFSGGVWTPYQSIGTGHGSISVAYSENGTASALWLSNTNFITASIFDGSNWQAPVTFEIATLPPAPESQSNLAIKMDANGNALAVWLDPALNVRSSYFNGSWQPTVTISTASGNINNISLGMSATGTAVAVWQDGFQNGVSAAFDGSSWQTPQIFGTNLATAVLNPPSVAVRADGAALVAYAVSDLSLNSAFLPLGGTWQDNQIITTTVAPSDSLELTVGADGSWFVTWIDESNVFASTMLAAPPVVLVDPPASITGKVVKNKFASQTDRIHVISFTASSSPGVAAYNIRRNGRLIATIGASSPYVYLDHNRCNRLETYTVTAVNANGVESTPVLIALR